MKNVAYYDKVYSTMDKYKKHYTKSKNYPIWRRIIKELKKRKIRDILDIGCGAGQFGEMAIDNGFNYFGFDFSKKGIELCQKKMLNVWQGDVQDKSNYSILDAYICTEVLEHIDNDIGLLKLLPSLLLIFISVPTFKNEAHVRRFKTKKEVKERYQNYIDITSIKKIGKRFLLTGRIKE